MLQSCNILHVDDDEDICVIVGLSLALDENISVYSVDNGNAALAALQQKTGERQFDLLLIDYQMPDMTGPDLLARVRALPGLETLPVIFLTARADAAVRGELERLGATGVLIKPFDPMNLAHDIRQLMSGVPRQG